MAVPPPSKTDLRRELKDRRQKFVFNMNIEDQRRSGLAVADRAMAHLAGADTAAIYLPIDTEIDTFPLIEALAAHGVNTALPHVGTRANSLRFLRWSPGRSLEDGPFGLKQPANDAEEVAPDLIFTPLLGFDRACNRIGYGAGYYDRSFAVRPRARRIGLAWAVQECEAVPLDPWDIALHAIATEKEWITP